MVRKNCFCLLNVASVHHSYLSLSVFSECVSPCVSERERECTEEVQLLAKKGIYLGVNAGRDRIAEWLELAK